MTSQNIVVPISEDTLDENSENLTLGLANPQNATITGTNPETLTITDNDPTPTLEFSATSTYTKDEGAGQFTIAVELSTASGLTVTVDYSTTAGTATAGLDYTTVAGTLTFTPGVTSQNIVVPISEDTLDENNETLKLGLANPQNATVAGTNPATLTITDNDLPPTVQIEAQVYSVDEAAGQVTITVTLSSVSELTATVGYATSDGTGESGAKSPGDYGAKTGTLTFSAGMTQTTITIAINDDAIKENTERFFVRLQQPQNATLGTIHLAAIDILDNDGLVEVRFSQTQYYGNESSPTTPITIELSGPNQIQVVVILNTTDGTAVQPDDYTAIVSRAVFFAPGAVKVTSDVQLVQDFLTEGPETLTLSLSSPVGAVLGTPYTATLIIEDGGQPVFLPIVLKNSN